MSWAGFGAAERLGRDAASLLLLDQHEDRDADALTAGKANGCVAFKEGPADHAVGTVHPPTPGRSLLDAENRPRLRYSAEQRRCRLAGRDHRLTRLIKGSSSQG